MTIESAIAEDVHSQCFVVPSRRDQAQRPANAPRGPAAERGAAASPRNSNIRSVSGDGGRRGGRGGVGRSTSGRGAREGRREPKTATDLDAELDAFMKAPAASKEAAQSVHAPVSDVALNTQTRCELTTKAMCAPVAGWRCRDEVI